MGKMGGDGGWDMRLGLIQACMVSIADNLIMGLAAQRTCHGTCHCHSDSFPSKSIEMFPPATSICIQKAIGANCNSIQWKELFRYPCGLVIHCTTLFDHCTLVACEGMHFSERFDNVHYDWWQIRSVLLNWTPFSYSSFCLSLPPNPICHHFHQQTPIKMGCYTTKLPHCGISYHLSINVQFRENVALGHATNDDLRPSIPRDTLDKAVQTINPSPVSLQLYDHM